jgi:outer membrane protein OmpA-like peptidoglycan-associated protein
MLIANNRSLMSEDENMATFNTLNISLPKCRTIACVKIVMIFILIAFNLTACRTPRPGPDKEGLGKIAGALTGAGSGAITGFQLGSGSGPGAAVGAGIGALFGGARGIISDAQEARNLRLAKKLKTIENRALAQKTIADFYFKRVAWHKDRDIFPADIFFDKDEIKLSPQGDAIISEFSRLSDSRFPWSRFGVAVYVKSNDPDSSYARYLAQKRALAITNRLIASGLEPRRIEAHGIVVSNELFRDPDESPKRYAQAIEFIPIDK